jgi:hypothetical protein
MELLLKVTLPQTNLIVAALQELPHKEVHELVSAITVQVQEQLKPKEDIEQKTKDKKEK